MTKIQRVKLYLFFFILFSTVVFAVLFPRLTLPFGFAYIIYLMAKPLTLRLTTGTRKQRLINLSVVLLGLTIFMAPIIATIYNLDTDFSRLMNQLPEVQTILQEKFFTFKVKFFEKFGVRLNFDPVVFLVSKLETQGQEFLARFPDILSTVFEWMLLVPMFLYFFFVESKRFSEKFMEAIPNSIFEKTYVLFTQFNTKFGEYIMAKFIEATILGGLVTIGLLVVGFPYPFILGFVAGITNILPYIGPVIGFVPAFFIALLSKDPNVSMFAMSMIFIVANLIDTVLVFPLLVSKIVNLNPIVVVVSIIIGSQLAGVIGMIVIIPFIAFFKLLFVEIYKDLSIQV
jgi:putative permease